MKKPATKWKILSWIIASLCAMLVVFWASLPRLLESTLQTLAEESGSSLESIIIQKFNPWFMQLSGLKIDSDDINISLNQLEARYDPVSLSKGKIHALSLTSPELKFDLDRFLHRFDFGEDIDGDAKNMQVQAEEFLAKPPLQFLRLRNASIIAENSVDELQSKLSAEGDFHPGLAQIRMDGNFTGLPWMADLTMVEEGADLFLGAAVHLTDLSVIIDLLSKLSPIFQEGLKMDLSDWITVDQGTAKAQWTGRIEKDGIMDQFMDINISDLSLQCLALSFNIPQAILFITPRSSTWIESNFYTNFNWGDNIDVKGLKISANWQDGKPKVNARVQHLQTKGVLPKSEILGLVIDDVEFAFGEEEEFIGVRHANLRFSALHLEEGLFNLYDGEVSLDWLGEDRFQVELIKANGSFPTIGLNLHNIGYEGEVAVDSLPALEKKQTLTVEEAFIGEDQKIEDLLVEFNLDSPERIEFSSVQMGINEFEFSFDPADFVIEMPESQQNLIKLSVMGGELHFADFEDFAIKDIIGNIKLNAFDPIESNGTQSIRFDLHAGEQVLPDGEVHFTLLSTGEKIIESVELHAFDGLLSLEKTKIGESLEGIEIRALANGLSSQKLISLFEELDAQMDGNFSGALNIRNDPIKGWDFYGGALSLDSSDNAKLQLNTHGMLTEGLEAGSSEFKNMYLLERALQELKLDAMNIIFKITEDGNRVVEMNIRGKSEVEGKDISVEYRPKIIGGLEALIQQADLSKWGITP